MNNTGIHVEVFAPDAGGKKVRLLPDGGLFCRWWKEIEVLIVTGATTGKVEANNAAIKNIKRTACGYRNPGNYK